MIRYIARSAQKEQPCADSPLSELGRTQAALLAQALKARQFHGTILTAPSPDARQTAQIVAEHTGAKVTDFPPMSAAERLMAHYHDACDRFREEELLFVGGREPVEALVSSLPVTRRAAAYNCALSAMDPDDPSFRALRCDTSHLPYEWTTDQDVSRESVDAAYFAKPWEGPVEAPDLSGFEHKLLHIGDTDSDCYPYYRALIDRVKPDIILHTGDMADEVKVGRIPGTRYEYLSKIRVLLDILHQSGAEVMIVPGNNDLREEIVRMAPEARVYPANERVVIHGVPCRVGHEVMDMTFDLPYAFYGHGFTGETWAYEKNKDADFRRFNVVWSAYVLDVKNGKDVRIFTPDRR